VVGWLITSGSSVADPFACRMPHTLIQINRITLLSILQETLIIIAIVRDYIASSLLWPEWCSAGHEPDSEHKLISHVRLHNAHLVKFRVLSRPPPRFLEY
jgi:hypothetical protein